MDQRTSVLDRLQCKRCGEEIESGCGCGVGYRVVTPIEVARAKFNPNISNRANAKAAGVDHKTVAKVREATGDKSPVEKREGLDGKMRRVPKPKTKAAPKRRRTAVAPPRPKGASEHYEQVFAFHSELMHFYTDFGARMRDWWHNKQPTLSAREHDKLVAELHAAADELIKLTRVIEGQPDTDLPACALQPGRERR